MEINVRRLGFLTSLLLLFVLAPTSTAKADSVTLTAGGTTTFQGYSAGPYSATLNGSPITMVCVSFDRHVSIGQTWAVTVNQLNAAGVMNALYYDPAMPAQSLLKYQRAAWLYDQLNLNFSDRANIQGAIWNIFNAPITPDTDPGSVQWVNAALGLDATFFSTYDLSKFRILTPVDRSASGPQENLLIVPEPASMVLLGTGLIGIGATLRKRRKTR